MHDLITRNKRRVFDEDIRHTEGVTEHPRFSRASWVAVAVVGGAALGAGATIYGSNKQAKANESAADKNAALQEKQNQAAWANWLMTRGIAPTKSVEAGVLPSASDSKAVNTRMPLWANVNFSPTGSGGIRLVKKGSSTSATGRPGITGFAN
jgi:hypothetical protein